MIRLFVSIYTYTSETPLLAMNERARRIQGDGRYRGRVYTVHVRTRRAPLIDQWTPLVDQTYWPVSNRSPATHQIWTQSVQPFLRYRIETCKCARAHCTLHNAQVPHTWLAEGSHFSGSLVTYQVLPQSVQPFQRYRTGMYVLCARADTIHLSTDFCKGRS